MSTYRIERVIQVVSGDSNADNDIGIINNESITTCDVNDYHIGNSLLIPFEETYIPNEGNESQSVNAMTNNEIQNHTYSIIENVGMHESLSNALQLETHGREHLTNCRPQMKSQERPYQCPVCGKCTITVKSMRIHQQRFHTPQSDKNGERCFICSKLVLKANLNQHLLIHTNLRLQCVYCDKTYKHKQTLRMHVKKHHPNCINYGTEWYCQFPDNTNENRTTTANDNSNGRRNYYGSTAKLIRTEIQRLYPQTSLSQRTDKRALQNAQDQSPILMTLPLKTEAKESGGGAENNLHSLCLPLNEIDSNIQVKIERCPAI